MLIPLLWIVLMTFLSWRTWKVVLWWKVRIGNIDLNETKTCCNAIVAVRFHIMNLLYCYLVPGARYGRSGLHFLLCLQKGIICWREVGLEGEVARCALVSVWKSVVILPHLFRDCVRLWGWFIDLQLLNDYAIRTKAVETIQAVIIN